VLESVGLNLAQLKQEMQSPEIDKILEQDYQDLKTLNVNQTPEFFVNGRPLPSFGAEQLQILVEQELANARAQKSYTAIEKLMPVQERRNPVDSSHKTFDSVAATGF
jgi:predicted DsbA family dithiol-disulfide isomerase